MFAALQRALIVATVTAMFGNVALSAERLALLPSQISLSTTESRQRLVVERVSGEQFVGDSTTDAAFSSSDEQVVQVRGGVAIPVGDGTATITAKVGDATATSAVTVTGQGKSFQWSFRNHVESVLSKSGCNAGACHGARAGQKGFRLTLFGFDLDADYSYLTRQAGGRRIVPSDPGRSLILTKPTGLIPHKGGVRFEPQSLEYRVLVEWIAAGVPGPSDTDPTIQSVEVFPKYSRQTVGAKQQLIVLARFSDAHVEDVTHWAKYTSVNMSVASVGDQGLVDITGSGEGAIKIWYLNHNVLAFLSVPYDNAVPAEVFANADRRNFIDELILQKLESLNLPPSPTADDATFIRRVFLDTIGVLPTADEVRAFLADTSRDKRDRLIDDLLARPEFVDYWTYKWSDLLLVTGDRLRPKAVEAYYAWIRQRVADNTPWDQFAREIVTASGSTLENGAANFYALHQDPTEMSETLSQAFLGLSINCAKCHNHPLEKWTNDQYYGMANLFSRVRAKGWGGDFRSGDGERIIFCDTQGELIQPSLGRPQRPRPLDAEPLAFDSTADRRIYLAQWLTSPDNPYFARAITNRIWANFFGVGLVEKVDDMRVTNPASNEELLDAAAGNLVEHRFDLKELMRAILQSAAYQRSSQSLPQNKPDERFYSRYYPRRLKAEVLIDALSQVTGVPTPFKTSDNKEVEKGTRALQLSDSSIASYFLSTFGRPERLITCDCERSDEPSMTQVLHIYNGDTLNQKLQAKDNRIDTLLSAGADESQLIDDLYLAALSRPPTETETTKLLAAFAETPRAESPAQQRPLIEDLYWSILSSREFLFNH
jgi:hypothetical protein